MRTGNGLGWGILALVPLWLAACSHGTRPVAPDVAPHGALAPTPRPRLPYERPIRAAYLYGYVSTFHLDSLALTGFNRAIVKIIPNPLDARGARELAAWVERGRDAPVEVTPCWTLQSRARLQALPTSRRYTWGSVVDSAVGCPLDPVFWRAAWLDRAHELMAAAPGIRRLALDLEIYGGARPHYREPCTCAGCLATFAAAGYTAPDRLAAFEEARLTQLLTGLALEFGTRWRGVELGVFDLDRDSFVHRALARALARAGVRTVDYTERTYSSGADPAAEARAALAAIGVSVPVVGGLWLKQFPPGALPAEVDAMLNEAEGWFAFTTFSLWVEPAKLVGPYALQGTQAEYWAALREANR